MFPQMFGCFIKALLQQYAQIKERLDNPKVASDALLKEISNTSAKKIMDSNIADNKGKVLYLNLWATWCGSCKAEMPNSIELMGKMKDKNVAFVFLCIDSDEKGSHLRSGTVEAKIKVLLEK